MSIIVSQSGNKAQRVEKSEVEKEDYLQDYIHNNPESIPVYELAEDKKLFVVKREFNTNAGPIDALAIDQHGDIYIVETKLYKNPDKRTVVAQALDYGAALWKHENDFNEFKSKLDAECQKKFKMSFVDKVTDFFNLEDAEDMFERMRVNLNEGNLKFVILMDSLGERLKDLILYVNQNSQFDIYAVQLDFYKFDEYEITIPRLFGVEVKKNLSSAPGPRGIWGEDKFIKDAQKRLAENEAEAFLKIYDYLTSRTGNIKWGTGAGVGSFRPIFEELNDNVTPFQLNTVGSINVNFHYLNRKYHNAQVEKSAQAFIEEYNAGATKKIPDGYLNGKPTFTIGIKEIVSNFDGLMSAIKKSLEF